MTGDCSEGQKRGELRGAELFWVPLVPEVVLSFMNFEPIRLTKWKISLVC